MKSLTRVWQRSHNAYQKKKNTEAFFLVLFVQHSLHFLSQFCPHPFSLSGTLFRDWPHSFCAPPIRPRFRVKCFLSCICHGISFLKRLGSVSYAESRPFSSVEEKWRPSTCSALVLLQKTSAVMIC